MSDDLRWLGTVGPGSVVAGYRIESRLGAGGMAVVFRAWDKRLSRMVALKLLAPQWAEDPQFRLRFIAESRAAAAVDDPHVIPIYEAGEADGLLFIAMRLVVGSDLRGIIRRQGAIAPARVLELLSPVASALDSAHEVGLIHRDVKPANILVQQRKGHPDHVYLSDFGLSKSSATGAVSLTGTGQYLGTPHYSSPEQCRGRPVDGRADQYALACVAYELLTSQVPFERDDGLAILLAHITEPPPSLTQRRPELAAAVDPVMAKALAKSPDDRYLTCRDFTDALRGALGPALYEPRGAEFPATPGSGHPGDGAPFPSPSRNERPVAAPAAAASTPVLDGAGRSAAEPAGGSSPLQPSQPRVPHLQPSVFSSGTGSAPGDHRAPPSQRQRRVRGLVIGLACGGLVTAVVVPLAIAAASAVSPTATLTDPSSQGVNAVAFGPGGTTLAVGDANGNSYLWNTATGKITATLADPDGNSVTSVAFGPGGTTLATGDRLGDIFLWNTATGKITATLIDPSSDNPGAGLSGVTSVAFGPGGTTLATTDDNGNTYLWNTATGKITATLTDPDSNGVSSVAFAPDGSFLATTDDNGNTYLWNTNGTINSTITDPGGVGLDVAAFGPDSTTLAAGDGKGNTYLWNDDGAGGIAATLTDPGSQGVIAVAFGPGGTTLAVGDANGSTYLWNTATKKITATLTNPDGDSVTSVTNPDGNSVTSVAFGPGGTTLATGDESGITCLWRITQRNP